MADGRKAHLCGVAQGKEDRAVKQKGALSCAALLLFLIFAPFFALAFDIKAVISAFFACVLLCAAWDRPSRAAVTKTALFTLICAVYAFLCIIWASDKGGEFFLALCAAEVCFFAFAVRWEKERLDERVLSHLAKTGVLASGVIYSVFSVLYQFFIADSAFAYRADFGSGCGYAAALLSTAGLLCALGLYSGKKKPIGFFAVAALLLYTLLLSRSILGYAAALFAFGARFMKNKKRRMEGAAALFGAFICIIIKVIYSFAVPQENGEYIKAALYGLSKIFGAGYGGYGAHTSLLPTGYVSSPPFLTLLIESWGIFGLLAVILSVFYALRQYLEKKDEYDAMALAALITALFSPCGAAAVILPMLAAYFTAKSPAANIKAAGFGRYLCAAAGCVLLYFAVSRIPFGLGESARAAGELEKAAGYYETCAKMEVFFSESWEKAFDAEFAAYEDGGGNADKCEEYIKNAARFGKDNLGYSKKLADLYTSEKKHDMALEIWDDMAQKCRDEYIYPEYAEKIYNCIVLHAGDAKREKELYDNLSALADSCEGADAKKSVNDALARAQKYYVSTIEGGAAQGDMFSESEPSEGESETESGNSES